MPEALAVMVGASGIRRGSAEGDGMASLNGVKVGDELLLILNSGRLQPEPTRVEVRKVGRKLIHVLRFQDSPDGGMDSYRIEDGVRNDSYGHSTLWKPEDWEAESQRKELQRSLTAHGISISWHGGPKSIAVLKALLNVMERAEQGEIT